VSLNLCFLTYSNSNQKLNNLNSSTDDFNPNYPPDTRDHDGNTNNNEKNEKIEKHIILANKYSIEPYNLSKYLANTKCNIYICSGY